MRRLIAAALLLTLSIRPSNAWAGGNGDFGGYTPTGPNTGEVAVGAEAGGAGQGTVGVHRTGRDPWAGCLFQAVDDPAAIAGLLRTPVEQLPPAPQGWWVVLCTGDGPMTGVEVLHVWTRSDGLPPAVRDRLVDAAVDALEVPYLSPQSSPAGTAERPLVTGLETWLWVDPQGWAPVQAEASIPAATVTAVATPVGLSWRPGDGSEAGSCEGPGQPWTPAAALNAAAPCGHVYDQTSGDAPGGTWPLGVTVRWEVTWSCSPDCGTGDAAPFVLTVTRPVTVEQVQTRLSR